MKRPTRSVQELRRVLGGRREQIEADLSILSARFDRATDLREVVKRHPLLTFAAGGALGLLLVRRPATLVRAAGRLAAWGAPILLSSVVERLTARRRHEGSGDVLEVQ